MKTLLTMADGTIEELYEHLLPKGSWREEAAFLYVHRRDDSATSKFDCVEVEKLKPDDFVAHHSDYIELEDSARIRLIKRAHALGASLVELHSHPGPWPAAFSEADRAGLRDTVPHMFWRLQQRPYLAIVVAKTGFDALVWIDDFDTDESGAG